MTFEEESRSKSPQAADVKQLVDKAQSGDLEAMDALFTRYHGTLVDLARHKLSNKLKLKEDPVDLAQTTFREATRDFSKYTYRGEKSFLGWLKQILANKIRDKAEYYSAGKRDLSRERTLENAAGKEEKPSYDPKSKDPSVTNAVQRQEEFEILREAVGELSAEHQQAIDLVFYQGLSLREAGLVMNGRSEDAVRMLLRRAAKRLGTLTTGQIER